MDIKISEAELEKWFVENYDNCKPDEDHLRLINGDYLQGSKLVNQLDLGCPFGRLDVAEFILKRSNNSNTPSDYFTYNIRVIELKARDLVIDDLVQVARYASGINEFNSDEDRMSGIDLKSSGYGIDTYCVLIGVNIPKDVHFLSLAVQMNCLLGTFEYSLDDGIYVEYHLADELLSELI